MFGYFKGDDNFEEELLNEQKRKRRTLYITFGILAFVLFNLVMYLLIAF